MALSSPLGLSIPPWQGGSWHQLRLTHGLCRDCSDREGFITAPVGMEVLVPSSSSCATHWREVGPVYLTAPSLVREGPCALLEQSDLCCILLPRHSSGPLAGDTAGLSWCPCVFLDYCLPRSKSELSRNLRSLSPVPRAELLGLEVLGLRPSVHHCVLLGLFGV